MEKTTYVIGFFPGLSKTVTIRMSSTSLRHLQTLVEMLGHSIFFIKFKVWSVVTIKVDLYPLAMLQG